MPVRWRVRSIMGLMARNAGVGAVRYGCLMASVVVELALAMLAGTALFEAVVFNVACGR